MVFSLAEIMETIVRGFASLFVLFIMTKLLGKKQVQQLTFFDYVIGISIGNFAAELTINFDTNIINGSVAVIFFSLVAYTVSYLTMKSIFVRKLITGTPTILIENGEILFTGLKKVQFDVNDLLQECRIAGFFDVSEINYAVMEENGKISFQPKKDYMPITFKDFYIHRKDTGLVANIIIDSNLMIENIEKSGITKKWLMDELKLQGFEDTSNILLATVDTKHKLKIYLKTKSEELNVLE